MLNTTECPNLRDLGGIRTKNGMVKPMRLIRSGALWRISNTAALSQLGAVFDMRSENERSFHPDPAFPGADYIHIQVSESGRRKFTQSKRTFEDKVDDILAGYYRGEQSASERMREVYRSIVFSENTAVCIRGIIRAANAERGAVLFHCATGKDRTGVVAALLLRLLGADDAAIYADYMRTNETLEHELAQAYSLAMSKSGNNKAAANYVLGFFSACPCWLTAALDTLDSNFGSSAEYAANAAGVGKEEVDRFIMICIEDNR